MLSKAAYLGDYSQVNDCLLSASVAGCPKTTITTLAIMFHMSLSTGAFPSSRGTACLLHLLNFFVQEIFALGALRSVPKPRLLKTNQEVHLI